MRGHGDHRKTVPAGIPPDHARGFEAVHYRHLDVHQHYVIVLSASLHLSQRLASVVCDIDLITLLAQDRHDDFLIHQIIFHQQQPRDRGSGFLQRERGTALAGGNQRSLDRLARQDHGEFAPLPNLAFHLHVTTLHLHQTLDDGQSQTGSSVLAGDTSVRLRELLENGPEFVRLDPQSGVSDFDIHGARARALDGA